MTDIPTYETARSILGDDFITPEEVMRARPGIVYTAEQITALAESLPSVDDLKWCRENGHAVMPAPPIRMSTLEIQALKPDLYLYKSDDWYANEEWARICKTPQGWLMIKKTPVIDSTFKKREEQKKLLKSLIEDVPDVAEMCWFITTYFETRGIRLFEKNYVRTSRPDSQSRCVYVGGFSESGLKIDSYWADSRVDVLGLAVARWIDRMRPS